jgi:hypothetical protein
MNRLAVAAVLCTALLALVAGCGDDDDDDGGGETVDAQSYTGTVCSTIGDWVQAIQAGAQETASLPQDATAEEGKEAISGFIDDSLAETTSARDALADAGVPDVEGGEEIADALVAVFDDAVGIFEQASADADALPTDSDQAFESAATELGDTTEQSLREAGDALAELEESDELRSAAQDAPECQELGALPSA